MKYVVYDNGGRTFDRYTIVLESKKWSAVYTMGPNGIHPQGVCSYCGGKYDEDGRMQIAVAGKKLKRIPKVIRQAAEKLYKEIEADEEVL